MNFLEPIFYFLDTLTVFDTCCLIAIYGMFLLLLANVCMRFKLSRVAECLHIIVFCVIVFTCFCLYSVDERSFNILRNSFLLKIAYMSNIAVFFVYIVHNLHKNRELFFATNDEVKYEGDCIYEVRKMDDNFKKKQSESCFNSRDGVYSNYNYYYKYNDKYAEPYTSLPKTKHINDIYADGYFFKNIAGMKYCIDNYNTRGCGSDNQFFKKNGRIEHYSEDDFIDAMNLEENISYNHNDEDCDKEINLRNELNFEQDDVFYKNKMSTFNNSYDLRKEFNVLDKVRNILQENNISFEEKISSMRIDMERLRDSIQGVVDRITKMFELFTVILQQQKHKS